MKELDMKLSKEVAKQAGEQLTKAKKEIEDNKDAYILILKDIIVDRIIGFLKKLVFALFVVNLILIASLIFVFVYSQNRMQESADRSEARMYDFISQYDFEGDVELDTGTIFNSDSSGNINVTR